MKMRISKTGWKLFWFGFGFSVLFELGMVAYYFIPEHRYWAGLELSGLMHCESPPFFQWSRLGFVLFNLPAQLVVSIPQTLLLRQFDLSVGWLVLLHSVGNLASSFVQWFVIALLDTRFEQASHRRRAARDPSSAAASESEGGDAG